jgi:hypothetical protein
MEYCETDLSKVIREKGICYKMQAFWAKRWL